MSKIQDDKCAAYEIYLEALEWYSLLDQEVSNYDSLKAKTLVLSTADTRGRVSSRNMTITGFDEDGFIFFTNASSEKVRDLNSNPFAALCAYWHPIRRQVSIEGGVRIINDETADFFWQKRGRDSQLSSWASDQSKPLESQQRLLNKYEEVKSTYRDMPVPRPPHWVGYRLVPDRIEFWRADWNRPNSRTLFEKVSGQWTKTLLYP